MQGGSLLRTITQKKNKPCSTSALTSQRNPVATFFSTKKAKKQKASIEELEKEIQEILSPKDSFPGEDLLTIPGVGEKTVAAVLSYLGADGSNFSTSTKAIGYVGFFSKIYQSGQTLWENTICKRGPDLLRWALYMATVVCLRHNAQMRNLYHKKLSQGKTEKQALICVAKKILQIMLAMLKSGEPYNPMKAFVSA